MKSLEKIIHQNVNVIGDTIANLDLYQVLQTSKLEKTLLLQIKILLEINTVNLEALIEINSFLTKIEE